MVSYMGYPFMPQHNVRIDETDVESQLTQVRGIHLAALPRSLATDRPGGTHDIMQQAAGSKRTANTTD